MSFTEELLTPNIFPAYGGLKKKKKGWINTSQGNSVLNPPGWLIK